MKPLFSLIVFIVVAIIVWWSISGKTSYNGTLEQAKKKPYLEIFMQDFKITAINSLGIADYTLAGKRLERYNNSANAAVTLPVFKFLHKDNQWLITAKQATINQKKNTILLQNNVVMQQQNQPQAVQITSQTMLINTLKQTASTTTPVQFKKGLSTMQASGMIFYNQRKILELNHNVHGFYLNTNPTVN